MAFVSIFVSVFSHMGPYRVHAFEHGAADFARITSKIELRCYSMEFFNGFENRLSTLCDHEFVYAV